MSKINAEVFIKVTELGSYKKAADALGYTQAGIGYIINGMEEELGIKLFAREYGGAKLTSEGRQLLPYMERLMKDENILHQKVNAIKDLSAGKLRILSFNSVSVCWLPDILDAFTKAYPKINVEVVTCEPTPEAISLIEKMEVDCGFFSSEEIVREIDFIPLKKDPLMVALSAYHPLADCDCFPIGKLDAFPYIKLIGDEKTEIMDVFRKHDVTPPVRMTLDSDYSAFAMISKNLGYGIFPKIMIDQCTFPIKGLHFDEEESLQINIGVKNYQESSLATKRFIAYVKKYVKTRYTL